MTIRPEDYLGNATIKRMRETKWYAMAHFINELLYNGSVQDTPAYTGATTTVKRFVAQERVYVGDEASFPTRLSIMGRDGAYLDTVKALRDLSHECERMAMKEVT